MPRCALNFGWDYDEHRQVISTPIADIVRLGGVETVPLDLAGELFLGLSRSGAGSGASFRRSPRVRLRHLAFDMKSFEVIMAYPAEILLQSAEVRDTSAPWAALRRIGGHGALAQIIPR